MEKKKDIANFFGDYINILNNVDYKIGFFKDLLDKAYLEMTQMLPKISANLKAMVKEIKSGTKTPMQAATVLTPQCSCGIFNPARATKLLAAMAAKDN